MTAAPDGVALRVLPTLERRGAELASAERQRDVLARVPVRDALAGDFDRHLDVAGLHPLRATGIRVLQLNLGRVCNQTCRHCHVDAGPDRRETMSREVADACLRALERSDVPTVDVTGGAPELCAEFRRIVVRARELGRHVMDRCNLTILLAPRFEDLPGFLAEHRVEVVCSLPHYRKLNTDKQRGPGVYADSIEALKRLNAVGYGRGGVLRLVLVTNPVGALLPAGQASLEAEWKRALERDHGIVFDALYTITNMPISRFLADLEERGRTAEYLARLVDAFNPAAAAGVMCRETLSVGYDGRLYDCDFNQMLDLELGFGAPRTIFDWDPAARERLGARRITTGRHCFGCTAGAGSSCGGATT
jgi:radical SAM/Cys-rich protein